MATSGPLTSPLHGVKMELLGGTASVFAARSQLVIYTVPANTTTIRLVEPAQSDARFATLSILLPVVSGGRNVLTAKVAAKDIQSFTLVSRHAFVEISLRGAGP